MELTAIFKSWHLGDGNYPLFSKGMMVNLSFEMGVQSIEAAPPASSDSFVHEGSGLYRFSGRVIRQYDIDGTNLCIIEVSNFRFYACGQEVRNLAAGTTVRGTGMLALDHYLWVEYLDKYEDPPNLFYDLRVERLTEVQMPERFITRHAQGMGHPTSLFPEQYGPEDTKVVESMLREAGPPQTIENYRPLFWIVDFSDLDVQTRVARTFIGAG